MRVLVACFSVLLLTWLSRGLDPRLKSVRLANSIVTLRKELLALTRAYGATHPTLVRADQMEMLDARFGAATLQELFGRRGSQAAPIVYVRRA